ncbi:MAG: O-methyltransferase [Bacillota bacterium]
MKQVLLADYLKTFVPQRDSLLKKIECEGFEDNIPIAQPQVAQLLHLLVTITKSKRILEIGTGTGYSTIWMARATEIFNGKVTTIELNHLRQRRAREYFQRAGLTEIIDSHLGNALDILPNMQQEYDFIFLDAAKGQYISFFTYAYNLLLPGGILVADNVLFKGYVVPKVRYPRRKRTLVLRLREFLNMLYSHPNLITTILPIGDGVAVVYRKD